MNKNEDMHPYRRFFVEQTYENIPKTWSKGKFPYENIEEFKSKVQKLSEYDAITAHETFLLPEDRYKNIPSNTLKFFKSRKCNYDSITLDTCNADIPMYSELENAISKKIPVIVIYCGDAHTITLEQFILSNYKPWMRKVYI